MFLPNRISQGNQVYDKYDFCLLNTLTMNVFIWALVDISMKFEVWFSNEKTGTARQF